MFFSLLDKLLFFRRKNVGWASTCNSVGQTAGYFLGYVVFLALESKDFCINYLGQNDSLITLPGEFFISYFTCLLHIYILHTPIRKYNSYTGMNLTFSSARWTPTIF